MPITAEQLRHFPADVFIETGSFCGDGIQAALDAGCFKQIISIELSEKWFKHCNARFSSAKNVQILLGDSGRELPVMLAAYLDLSQTFTFWLDGHDSGPGTARGEEETPLIKELAAIKQFTPNASILIDDMRGWYRDVHGFDRDTLRTMLLDINPQYKVFEMDGFVINDILAATI